MASEQLIAELDHRVKNILAQVAAVSSATRQGSRSIGEFLGSLDGRTVTARSGIGDALRMQRLRFDSVSDARIAYFERLEDLSQKGYLDATQD